MRRKVSAEELKKSLEKADKYERKIMHTYYLMDERVKKHK